MWTTRGRSPLEARGSLPFYAAALIPAPPGSGSNRYPGTPRPSTPNRRRTTSAARELRRVDGFQKRFDRLPSAPYPAPRELPIPSMAAASLQSPIFPALAQSYSPALLNSSVSAGNRGWRSRNSAMKSVHTGSCDSCRYRSRTLVRCVHACR